MTTPPTRDTTDPPQRYEPFSARTDQLIDLSTARSEGGEMPSAVPPLIFLAADQDELSS
jgi:hypothetical protein